MRPKKTKWYCGNHTFVAWSLKGQSTPVRKCLFCDYEQTRAEYFFKRKKAIERLKPILEIAKRSEHIDLFI